MSPRSTLIVEIRGTWPTFTRQHLTPAYGPISSPSPLRLDTVGTAYTAAGTTGLAAIQAVLASGTRQDLDAHLTGDRLDQVGAILFTTLLGDEATWATVLRRVFGRPEPLPLPDPGRGPVRVLIRTNDTTLQGLPWRATMWGGTLLVDEGWTFEIDLDDGSSGPVEHRAPGSVLVIAPDYPGMPFIATGAHLLALAEAFEKLAPGHGRSPMFEIVRTEAEVKDKLAGMAPDIVYFYGHGDAQGQQLRLLLGSAAEEPVLVRDFAAWLGKHPPRLAFFNGCRTGQAGWHSAGWQIGRKKVPLVVSNATSAWPEAAGSFAVRWFKKWLGEGMDPVVALHAREMRASSAGFEWLTPIVHSACQGWTTHRAVAGSAGAMSGSPEDWLDRNEQRARGSFDVLELVDDPHRRVMAAAACAPPGNHLDRIARQIIHRIERHSGARVHARHLPLKFPQQRGPARLAESLEHALKLQLGHKPADALEHVLRKQARGGRPGVVTVLWADWGVFGDGAGCQAKLSGEELRIFIAFARDRLAKACSDEQLRVVTSVAIEQVPEKIEGLHGQLKKLAGALEHRTSAFVFKVIPPLKDAELVEIVEYLEQADCARGILERLAESIHGRTGGRYHETVELLRRGHGSSWHDLLREIGEPEGPASDPFR